MSLDISRVTFKPENDYSGVVMQQGRVQLDSDWNEWLAELTRRIQAGTLDILDRAVYPATTPHAFEITASSPGGTNTLLIGPGRMYVDGLLAENHGDPAAAQWDPALGEMSNAPQPPLASPTTGAIDYTKQPYMPPNTTLPPGNGPFLAYLDVWVRPVDYINDPDLIDAAVGVDSTGRLQTVWQVRLLDLSEDDPGATCDSPISNWPPPASAGLLSTGTTPTAPSGPCCLTSGSAYTGLENQFYRVEIHQPGTPEASAVPPADLAPGIATFKWSRDNGSVITSVTSIANVTNSAGNPASQLAVQSLGRDQVLGFAPGNWIEILDDSTEFSQTPGELHQIDTIDLAANTITLATTLGTGFPAGDTDPSLHTRIRRWDQSGKVYEQDGTTVWWDIDAQGTADIPVPPAGTTLILENGITVSFDLIPPSGGYNPGDFWTFFARTATGEVEKLDKAAPRGIHHHYARLSIVTFPNSAPDCRHLWPPAFGEAGCDCSVCVTADSHNSNTLTLQQAVTQVSATGGKICLGPGIYLITSPVPITRCSNIEISGHGLPNLVASGLTSQQPIFQIDGCVDINIEDIAFTGPVVGVTISNSWFTRIKRCLFTGDAESSPMSLGVGFSSFVWAAQVQDCFFNNVQIGIGPPADAEPEAFIGRLSIQNNQMICTTAGFSLEDTAPLFLEFCFADNLVTAPIGFQFGGKGLDIAIERNSFALTSPTAASANAAIVCAGSQVRISSNQILSADPGHPGTDGIVLGGGLMYGTQVTGNRIDGLDGHGILIKERTDLRETAISQNQLLGLGGAGIMMEQGGVAFDLNITSNAMTFVGMKSGVDAGIAENPTMAGILLLAPMMNVNVNENTIEGVGPDPTANDSRAGIELLLVIDFRAAGNRIVDVGPPSIVGPSAGIAVYAAIGRVDIADNEVRRTGVPPFNGDTSAWFAIWIVEVAGNVAIRGNILESFGVPPTAFLGFAFSCVFTDNQCFLDNSGSNLPILVVWLGFSETSNAGAIMASNNFVQASNAFVQGLQSAAIVVPPPLPVMLLNPKDKDKTLTVVGNITSGDIFVGTSVLDPNGPWAALNVQNV